MRLVVTRDRDEFVAQATEFLAASVERNILATVLLRARRGHYGAPGLFAYGVDRDGDVCAAALRTPPAPLLACDLDEPAAAELMDLWLAEDPQLGGVCGPTRTARAVAAAWERHSGGRSRCHMRERMQLLSEVREPPRPASGHLRRAEIAERDLLIAWEEAFAVELDMADHSLAARSVDGRMAGGGQLVWDDGGPVSTLGASPEIAGVVRIGPVYTPPEHRCRGYAGSAVAAACRAALASGASRCMLFTDVDNPTSNKIYASVGFRPAGTWEDHRFERP
jgi:predicted GNAT family acetyltransferase